MDVKTFEFGEGTQKAYKYIKKYRYMIIVILAGIILLLIPASGDDDTAAVQASQMADDFSLGEIESHMEEVLSQVDGAGRVEVILTLRSSTEMILAEDEETSYQSSGDQEEVTDYETESNVSTVIVSTGSGTEEAVVIKKVYPEYLGALVVCEGAGSSSVRLKIVNAVSSLTGLGADKIAVIKMKD